MNGGGDIQGVLSGAGFAALSALFLSEVTATIWELRWMELAIFVLVVADFCWGIADSVAKRGEEFHFSRAGRRTACKLLEYNFYLVGGMVLGKALCEPLGICGHVEAAAVCFGLSAVFEVDSITEHVCAVHGWEHKWSLKKFFVNYLKKKFKA